MESARPQSPHIIITNADEDADAAYDEMNSPAAKLLSPNAMQTPYDYNYTVTPTPPTTVIAGESKISEQDSEPPANPSTELYRIIHKSEIPHSTPSDQRMQLIVNKFNKEPVSRDGRPRVPESEVPVGVSSSPLLTWIWTDKYFRLAPNELALVAQNHVPSLVAYTNQLTYLKTSWIPTNTTQFIGRFNLNTGYFGAYGSRVMVVPEGKYALVVKDGLSLVYDEGTHIIHAMSSIKFKPQKDYISQSTVYIQHGNLNIITVPIGKIAAVTHNNDPYLLIQRDQPYVFTSARFTFDGLVPEDQRLIVNHSLKRLYPQLNCLAVVSHLNELKFINLSVASPIYLKNASDRVLGFISIIQKLTFPLVQTKGDSTIPSYRTFKSLDGVVIGVKLIVSYEITDLSKLVKSGITFSDPEIDALANFMEEVSLIHAAEAIQIKDLYKPLSSTESKLRENKEENPPRKIDLKIVEKIKQAIENTLTTTCQGFGIAVKRIGFDLQINPSKTKTSIVDDGLDYKLAKRVTYFFDSRSNDEATKNHQATIDTEVGVDSSVSSNAHPHHRQHHT